MKVTVYSTPNCVQCRQTKAMFDRAGVVYDSIDLAQHPELVDSFKDNGHLQAPIVVASDDTGTVTWSGFRHGKITGLIQRLFGDQSAKG